MALEILTLNSMLVLLSYMTNPSSLSDSKFFIYFQNLNLNFDLNVIMIFAFVNIFIFKTFFNIFKNWKENKFIHLFRAELSHVYFKGYLYLPRIFHLRTNTSDLINNITVEVTKLMIAVHALAIIVMEFIVLIGIAFFLLFINYKLTIISFFLLTIFSFLLSYVNSKKIMTMGKNIVKINQLKLKSIIEGFSGSKAFELTGSQKYVLEDFSKQNIDFAKISYNVGFRNTLPRPLFELFILLIVGSIVISTFQDKSQITNIIPTLGVFLTAAYRLMPSFARIVESVQKFQFNIQSAEKLSRDKDKFTNIQNETKDTTPNMFFKNSIVFQKVSFSYNKNLKLDSNFVLKDVNFEIAKGSKIGIVGKSGSGKSTFLDIMMGLNFPQFGEILIDGKKINNIKARWQKVIGCVPQEVFILDDTLRRNVAFGLPEASINNDKVASAIRLANLEDFKNSLKFGLETLVGESGSRLSGGQRQRIGIARALYNEPNVLIFDEATNALDEQTERKIIKEIFETKKEKTIIFVSHNLKNLSLCDKIYEVKNKNLYKLN